MDIKAYIASGVLEAYLMGELDEQEILEVDRLARKYPVIRQELEELREALNKYATATGKKPPSRVLDEALNAIREEEKEAFIRSIQTPEEDPVVIKRVNIIPVWSVAATLLLLVSIGFNIFFFTQMEKGRDQVRLLSRDNTLLADQVRTTDEKLDHARLRIAHFLNEDNIHIRMNGLALSPESFANVFWNKRTNAVFISVDNLPEPPHGHQYQLWAIKEGQPPIDAGIFDHHERIQELKVIKGDVLAFAVTLEEEGGTQHASVDKTYVKGYLKKS